MTRILVIIPLAILSSCAPTALYPTVGAGVGAGVAGIVSDGNPIYTGLGALGGAGAGYLLANAGEKSKIKAYNDGYDNGQSNAAKQLAEAQKNLQKAKGDQSSPPPATRVVSIPAPRQDAEGINYVDTDIKIRVED